MVKHSLTDLAIRSMSIPRQGQSELWDSRLPGFGVRASHGGTKSFVLMYRYHGRQRRMTLGRYPILRLSEARQLAYEALRAAAFGTDPQAEKLKVRNVPEVEHFDSFVRHFIETYARPKNRTADDTERVLMRHFGRAWGTRAIKEITKQDVMAVIDGIMAEGNHASANKALAVVRKLFNWAVERGLLDQSPCAGINAPARSTKRDRVLSDDEFIAIWRAAIEMGYPFGSIVQLLLLTGQRREEVAGLRWSELDLTKAIWSLGALRTKSNRAHVVPLPPLTVSILSKLPRFNGDLMFPARGSQNPVSGFAKWKDEIDGRCHVKGWRLHDLRRTAATGMARLGVSPHVVERLLNHTSGTFGGVAGVYNRFGYLPEMRTALERWSDHISDHVEIRATAEILRP